jgi:hypothetical protein
MIRYPSIPEAFHENQANAISRAYRVRGTSMRFGILISVLTFFLIGGDVLLDQWTIGSASAVFMLGTELVIAGACIGLFAIIAAIGWAISTVFENRPSIANKRATIDLDFVE